ncbi:hypothetical protein [Amycolatopsis sp. FDAARGOS 1241]|uniref:hypothetical protein n=1 Tax=Amycolatopsis sp. FDAARGOS 1241 TaxID=2778070 RepID=UPI00194F2043|nr:hypothetical protein [Amycolatopsis sp. FDAARGOS 1241]QRP43768.1 hypothetical protein I6J71_31025 [Amycolatopsis sp. FDAARGOS 1241]
MLGADRTWSPERAVALFGGDESGENRHRHQLWYDFGLVEFFWDRARGDQPWSGTHFSVQARRLAPAPALAERYGPFDGAVTFAALAAELDRRSAGLVEEPGHDDNIREYWQAASATSVLVVAGGYHGRPGDVYRVTSPVYSRS